MFVSVMMAVHLCNYNDMIDAELCKEHYQEFNTDNWFGGGTWKNN